MAKAFPMPPPYKGENDRVPLAELESPYAEISENFALDNGVAVLRRGTDLFCTGTGTNNDAGLGMAKYGSTKLFRYWQNLFSAPFTIQDITSGTASTVQTVNGAQVTVTASLFYNKFLYIFGNGALDPADHGPQYYDGSSWGGVSWTWPSSFIPLGGCAHKRRAYIIGYQSATYVYTDIDVAGSGTVTPTLVDLSDQLSIKANLLGICSLALSEGIEQDNVAAFVFDSGEVLVYHGSYPDGSNWGLAGRFFIPRPFTYSSFCPARGDVFVVTEGGPISLRSLFQQGSEIATNQGIASLILNRWQYIYANGGLSNFGTPTMVYDQLKDRLIVAFANWVARPIGTNPTVPTSSYFFLIYSFRGGSWFEYYGSMKPNSGGLPTLQCVTAQYFGNTIYFLGSRQAPVFSLETRSDYQDKELGGTFFSYGYRIRSAPINSPKFGANQITGIEAITQSDLYANTGFFLVGDLGRVTTNAQFVEDQGSSILKPMANVGLSDISYAQIDLHGTTTSSKTVGLTLNGFNVWYEAGAQGTR